MNCEYCNRSLLPGDMVHEIKYGSLASSGFISAKDSAISVVCGQCGNMLLRLVYAKYDPAKPTYPTMFKMYEELASCMKNGFKLIQAISKLPSSDLSALKRIISICKESK